MVALDPDGILISPGLLRRSSEAFGFRGAPSAILRADLWAVDSRVRRERDQHRMLAEPEDAVRLGADAMAMMLVLGTRMTFLPTTLRRWPGWPNAPSGWACRSSWR